MKILVDADACPVKSIIEEVAREFDLPLMMIANVNHIIDSDYATVVVVDGASQAADITIINLAQSGDIIVTQDYGLAALALAKQSLAIDPQGKSYTPDNIDGLLMRRYINFKAREAGHRTHGPSRRAAADDILFANGLRTLIIQNLPNIIT